MWRLQLEPGSTERALRAFSCWATFLALLHHFLRQVLSLSCCLARIAGHWCPGSSCLVLAPSLGSQSLASCLVSGCTLAFHTQVHTLMQQALQPPSHLPSPPCTFQRQAMICLCLIACIAFPKVSSRKYYLPEMWEIKWFCWPNWLEYARLNEV